MKFEYMVVLIIAQTSSILSMNDLKSFESFNVDSMMPYARSGPC